MQKENEKIEDFIEYVLRFYGKDGLYPMIATYADVRKAVRILRDKFINVQYDSIDRERVREILVWDIIGWEKLEPSYSDTCMNPDEFYQGC